MDINLNKREPNENEIMDKFYSNFKIKSKSKHKIKNRPKEDNRKKIEVKLDDDEIIFSDLPILNMKNTILDKIELHRVVVICGDTGCGKTTQIPLYLYHQYKIQNKLNELKILCVQPRRLACINIAERLSFLCKNKSHVGYHISLDLNKSYDTKILFVTNGIFKNYLVHNPNILNEYSHIILDEVHERDIDSDFNLIMLKCLFNYYTKVKLILMSATINENIFSNYFSIKSIENVIKKFNEQENKLNFDVIRENMTENRMKRIKENELKNINKEKKERNKWKVSKVNKFDSWKVINENEKIDLEELNEEIKKENNLFKKKIISDSAPIIEISVKKKYEIKEYFIDTLVNFNNFKSKYLSIFKDKNQFVKKAYLIDEVIKLSIHIILHIFRINPSQKLLNTNFLIFLPGLNEILIFEENLLDKLKVELKKKEYNISLNEINFIKLHSSLDGNFEKLKRVNKSDKFLNIILATNIAESSLTIKNVSYIIDFCLTKELYYDNKVKSETLHLIWSSQASCKQRMGRTGRICNGICFFMVTYYVYKNYFNDYSNAEILRTPLDKIILKINNLFEQMLENYKLQLEKNEVNDSIIKMIQIFKSPVYVLKNALEPPEIVNIINSLSTLVEIGALEKIENFEDDELLSKHHKNIFTDDQYYLKSTFLGKLYSELPCNINLTKLVIYGYYFGVLDETITIVAIYSNIKKFVKFPNLNEIKNEKEKTYILLEYLNFLKFYRIRDDDDSIFLLDLYKDIISKFGERFRLNYKFENNLKNENILFYNYIDFKTLKFIIELKKNIMKKIEKLGINLEQKYNIKEIRDKKIKLCILASFYPKIIKGELCNFKDVEKSQNLCIENDLDPNYTIIFKNKYFENIIEKNFPYLFYESNLNKLFNDKFSNLNEKIFINVYKEIMDKKIKSFYKNIKNTKIIDNNYYIEFYENGINEIRKILFIYDQKKRYNNKSYIHSIKENGYKTKKKFDFLYLILNEIEKKFVKEIQDKNNIEKELYNDIKIFTSDKFFDVVFINKYRYYDFYFHKEYNINFESNLYNFISNSKEKSHYFVPLSLNEQINKKGIISNISYQFSFNHIPEILNLIFNNNFKLYCNEKNNNLDRYEFNNEIKDFEFYFDEDDIKLINIIKQEIYNSLYNFKSEIKNNISEKIFEYIIILFKKNKKKLLYKEIWYNLFEDYDNENQNNDTNKKIFQIILLKSKIPNLTSNESIKEINSYIKWKKDIIKKYELVQNIIYLKKPKILCNNCKYQIISLDYLINYIYDINLEKKTIPFKINKIWLKSMETNDFLYNQIHNSNIKNIELIRNYKYTFYCIKCEEIYGLSNNQNEIVIYYDDFLIKLQNNEEVLTKIETFDYEEFEEKKVYDAEQNRKEIFNAFNGSKDIDKNVINFGCIICLPKEELKIKNELNLIKHFESKIHLENHKLFTENI